MDKAKFWTKMLSLGPLHMSLVRNQMMANLAKNYGWPYPFAKVSLDRVNFGWFFTLRISAFYVNVDLLK